MTFCSGEGCGSVQTGKMSKIFPSENISTLGQFKTENFYNLNFQVFKDCHDLEVKNIKIFTRKGSEVDLTSFSCLVTSLSL